MTETKPAAISRQEANRRMYGGPAEGVKPQEKPSRRGATQRMYPAGGYGGALASYYDRRQAHLRDDKEQLEISRQEKKQIEAFARKRRIPASDLQEALVVMLEHEAHPKTQPAIEQRWAQTFEQLRLDCGGRENAQKLLDGYVAVTKDLVAECPTLADRAGLTGAANDVRIIKNLARFGEQQPAVKE